MNGNDPLYSAEPATGISDGTGRLSHLSPRAKVLLSIGLPFVLYILVGLASDVLIRQVYGYTSSEMIDSMDAFLGQYSGRLNPYRLMQIMSTVIIFGLSSFLLSYLFTGRLTGIFQFSKAAKRPTLLFVPFIMLFAFPVISLVFFYVSQLPVPESLVRLEEGLEKFTSALLSETSAGVFLLNFLMIAILPALFEELLFRGVIQRLAARMFNSAHLGILLSGLIFGFIHGQVFRFLPIAVLGILLGYLYWWTRNLWFPILGHFFHNGIQVVVYYLAARGLVDMDLDSPQMLPPAQTAMFAVLFAGITYLFYYVNRKKADEPI
jgi:membrane protease YdiL (CAAX protease family)